MLKDMGSPPPMRGKENFKVKKVQHIRITPAYAGKRLILTGSFRWHRDHPRLCGEKRKIQILTTKEKDHPRLCGEKR